jgi:hypothetical protein
VDHQYSFTDRMQTLFIGGSILLALLIFVLGLVVGHLWWPVVSPDAAPVAAHALHPKSAASGSIRRDPAPTPQTKQEKPPPATHSTSDGAPSATAAESAPAQDAAVPSPPAAEEKSEK